MMRVLFRADASTQIGTGHVVRCLALASELRERGCESTFAMRPMQGNLMGEVVAQGHAVIELDLSDELDEGDLVELSVTHQRASGRQARDAKQMMALLAGHPRWDWLVVDHYALGAQWQLSLRPVAGHILVIDDLADRALNCDVLLDQNPQHEGRYRSLVAPQTTQVIGPAFALLRQEFGLARETLQRAPADGRPLRVLVSFGGADPKGVALDAVAALAQCNFAHGHVVVVAGSRNPHLSAMQAACALRGYQCITSTSQMAHLMSTADLCIGAGGTTMIECFVLGLASIVVPIADNQRPGALAARDQGAVVVVDQPAPLRVQAIAAALHELVEQPERLARMSRAAAQLCDGRGAARVAAELQQRVLTLVPAQASDAQRLFDWRNAPETRAHSGSPETITFDGHRRWLAGVLTDPSRRLWIAMLGDEAGQPVGVVRFDAESHAQGLGATISIYRVPGVRGRGWGRAVIARGVALAGQAWPDLDRIDARISPDNQASLRAFAACGFLPGDEPGVHYLSLRSFST